MSITYFQKRISDEAEIKVKHVKFFPLCSSFIILSDLVLLHGKIINVPSPHQIKTEVNIMLNG